MRERKKSLISVPMRGISQNRVVEILKKLDKSSEVIYKEAQGVWMQERCFGQYEDSLDLYREAVQL